MAYYSLILVFVLMYDRPGTILPFIDAAKLGTIVPILVFLSSMFVKSRISHEDVWKNGTTRWLLYLIFLVVVSLIFNSGPDTLERLKLVVGNFFLFFSICRIIDTKEKLLGIFKTLGFCHVFLIILNPDLILDPSTRTYVSGMTFLGDGNDFGLSLVILFPLVAVLFLDAKKKYIRIINLGATFICVFAIVGTQSRGASLALGCVLLYLWLKSRRKVVGVLALVILVVAGLLFASPQYFARMGTLSHYHEEGSAQGRLDAWSRAIGMATVNPVLGVGAGNFGIYNNNLTAHSMYFLALGEFGIPGAIFIVLYMIHLIRKNRRRIKELTSGNDMEQSYQRLFIYLNGSVIGFAVAGAFLSVLYYPHLFVLGGLLLVAHKIYELDKASDELGEETQTKEKSKLFVNKYDIPYL